MLTTAVYIIVTSTILIFLLSHFLKNRELGKRIAHIPGPPTVPLLGCAYLFLGNTEDVLKSFTKLFNTYSSPCRIELGPRLYIGIHDPEQIKAFLMSPQALEKDVIYKFGYPWVGWGLLTAPVSVWRIHRKLIQPAFNPNLLKAFIDVFQKHSKVLIKEMSLEVDGKEFHPVHPVSSCTLNILCESFMGVSMVSEKERGERYTKAAAGAFQAIVTRTFKVWLYPDIIFNLTKTAKMFYKNIEYMHSVTNFVIKKRREDLENGASKTIQALGQKKPFLDLLLGLSENGKIFSDQEVREEVNTFIFGGHDTTANSICFVLLMLASHPDIQDKAYKELYNIYGTEDPEEIPVKYEDLSQLNYLERIIKETLRLFPVTPLLARRATDDLNIGFIVPKNCSVLISVFKLHRDEKHWPDPLKFDPERFLPEVVDKRHPYAFIPFSTGPRSCIGLTFAMMSMKMILATVLRKYVIKMDKIRPIKDIRLKIDILLKPVEPIAIRIENRIQ